MGVRLAHRMVHDAQGAVVPIFVGGFGRFDADMEEISARSPL